MKIRVAVPFTVVYKTKGDEDSGVLVERDPFEVGDEVYIMHEAQLQTNGVLSVEIEVGETVIPLQGDYQTNTGKLLVVLNKRTNKTSVVAEKYLEESL